MGIRKYGKLNYVQYPVYSNTVEEQGRIEKEIKAYCGRSIHAAPAAEHQSEPPHSVRNYIELILKNSLVRKKRPSGRADSSPA